MNNKEDDLEVLDFSFDEEENQKNPSDINVEKISIVQKIQDIHPKEKKSEKEILSTGDDYNVEKIGEFNKPEKKVIINTENTDKPKKENNSVKNEIQKEKVNAIKGIPKKTKKKIKIRGIIAAIFIFGILGAFIYYLPAITSKLRNENNSDVLNTNSGTNSKESGIKIKNILNDIKEDKNYVYEQIIESSVIGSKNNTINVSTDITYSFNPTKIKIDTTKIISDANENLFEYYEKIDNTYNKYIYDITTKKNNLLTTNENEFNSIYNIFPKLVDNLLNHTEISKETQNKTDDEKEIIITTKNDKSIFNILSFKTDQINSEINIDKLNENDVNVNYVFDSNKKLKQIELELITEEGYIPDITGKVASTTMKFIFKDFNTVKDIEIPEVE